MKKYKCSKCGKIETFNPLPKDKNKKRIATYCSFNRISAVKAFWVLQEKKTKFKK
jgi:DNA-directed RNA polymerase subunit RPC12/RpoP